MKRLEKNDVTIVEQLIQTEFPYLKKPKQQLESKFDNPFFFLFKITHQKQLAGFIEFEVLEENTTVRLNGLAILPRFRNKKLGTRLLQEGLNEIKRFGFRSVFLLVKQENRVAKKMYERKGFRFVQTLSKPIDHSIVDEYWLEFKTRPKKTHSIV